MLVKQLKNRRFCLFTVKQRWSRDEAGARPGHTQILWTFAFKNTSLQKKDEDLRSTTLGSRAHAPQPSHTSPGPPPCYLVWRTETGSGSTPLGYRSYSPERETTCSRRLPNTLLQTYRPTHDIRTYVRKGVKNSG